MGADTASHVPTDNTARRLTEVHFVVSATRYFVCAFNHSTSPIWT